MKSIIPFFIFFYNLGFFLEAVVIVVSYLPSCFLMCATCFGNLKLAFLLCVLDRFLKMLTSLS